MNRVVIILSLLVYLGLSARCVAFDILYLEESGAAMKCRIEGLGDDFIKATVLIERPGSPARKVVRSFRLTEIDYIDFDTSGEALDALGTPGKSPAVIRDEWNEKRRYLGIRKSNAGDFGLALGNVLLESDESAKIKVALDTFRLVEQSDWDETRRALAQQGRLRCLLALGQAEKALAEAKVIARESEDPVIMIEAHYVMARATRQDFEALLEENPKWREDDEVREEVEAAFNDTIDRFLYASLFFGSHDAQAARGLWNAAEVFNLAGESAAARDCAKDIVALYQGTDFAERARKLLAKAGTATPASN